MWDTAKQQQLDELRQREQEGTLTDEERRALEQLLHELEQEEWSTLRSAPERLRQEEKEQLQEAGQVNVSEDGLEARVARLEATVAELQDVLRRLLAPPTRVALRTDGYSWVEPPAHLKDVTDYSQLEPEDLVYLHELTEEDVRRRLEELEQWYGMSSEEFYQRWQRGEADDVYHHKIEWSILYEHWLQIQAQSSPSDGKTE